MRRATLAWPLRLALASTGLWACNALTGANNLVIEGQSGSGAQEGNGGTGADDDNDDGDGDGDGDEGGGGSASGGKGGAGPSVTCGATETTGAECRNCCANQRRGIEALIPLEQIDTIRSCLCERSSSGGLSERCQGCRDGICPGRDNPDQAYVSDCNVCFKDGMTCPALTVTCRNQPEACDALVTCFHTCQSFE